MLLSVGHSFLTTLLCTFKTPAIILLDVYKSLISKTVGTDCSSPESGYPTFSLAPKSNTPISIKLNMHGCIIRTVSRKNETVDVIGYLKLFPIHNTYYGIIKKV